MFCDRTEKMMIENAKAVRRSVLADEEAQRKRAGTTPRRNENKSRKAATSALTFMTFS
jgi:hypothetical protein